MAAYALRSLSLHARWHSRDALHPPLHRPLRHSYHAEPSGTYTRYQAKAVGSGSEGAQTSLQETFRKDMTLAEAEVRACMCVCVCRGGVCVLGVAPAAAHTGIMCTLTIGARG
jgi:hypothetical protein